MQTLRVVCYLNQFFGQLGGEDKAGIGPQVMAGAVGAARAVQQVRPVVRVHGERAAAGAEDRLEPIPIGQARVHREGEDVTVVATGRLVHESLAAAEEAEKEGVSVEVVDPRTLQPLDEQRIVDSVKKTNRCVVAHEAVTRMGFGAEVAAVVQHQAFDWLDAPVERVGAKFVPLPFAPVMEEFVVPHQAEVYEAIMRTVGRNGS
jgi:pyruvate/2-oxoglutarate/acetoin dehydrogenase E1 component